MQGPDKPKTKLSLMHQSCLNPEKDKNRHPRGIYSQKVPCVCGRCHIHFKNGEMTFWVDETNIP